MLATHYDLKDLLYSKKIIAGKDVSASFDFIYNYKCNAACSVCYDLNKPTDKYVDDKYVEQWLKECAEKDILFWYGSGEPFLNYDWLKDFFIPCAKQYNAKYAICTNGFWGSTQVSIDKIKQLKVKNLVVSFDKYHQEFIPKEYVQNIVEDLSDEPDTNLYIGRLLDETAIIEGNPFGEIEDQIQFISFFKSDKRIEETNTLTNDFDGNIIQNGKIIGKSINNAVFTEAGDDDLDTYVKNTEHYLWKLETFTKKYTAMTQLPKSSSANDILKIFYGSSS